MSAQVEKTVFFLGGTGYVGSAVLSRFLALETKHTYNVLTRSEEKAKLIEQLRPGQVKGVQGTHQDLELIEKLASESDIVVNCADSDDVSRRVHGNPARPPPSRLADLVVLFLF
jgi:nucleoside-diphosphate-sugar epimerase